MKLIFGVYGNISKIEKYIYNFNGKKIESFDIYAAILKYFKEKGEKIKLILYVTEDLEEQFKSVYKELLDDIVVIKVPELKKLENILKDGCPVINLIHYLYFKTICSVKELLEFEDIGEFYYSNIRGLNFLVNVVYDIVRRLVVRELFKYYLSKEREPKFYIITTLNVGSEFKIRIIEQQIAIFPYILLNKENLQLSSRKLVGINNKDVGKKISKFRDILQELYFLYVIASAYYFQFIMFIHLKKNNILKNIKEVYTSFVNELLNIFNKFGFCNNSLPLFSIDLLFAASLEVKRFGEFLAGKIKTEEDEIILSREILDNIKLYIRNESYKALVEWFNQEVCRLYNYLIKMDKKEFYEKCAKSEEINDRNFKAHRGLIYNIFEDYSINRSLLKLKPKYHLLKEIKRKILSGNIYLY